MTRSRSRSYDGMPQRCVAHERIEHLAEAPSPSATGRRGDEPIAHRSCAQAAPRPEQGRRARVVAGPADPEIQKPTRYGE